MADEWPDEAWLAMHPRINDGVWQGRKPFDASSFTPYLKRTPARANAEKMLEALKVAQKNYCRHNCCYPYHPDKPTAHAPDCLSIRAIIAAAEGRGENDAG